MLSKYRLISNADLEQYYQLYLYAFNTPDEPRRRQYFFDRLGHGLSYGLKNNSGLTSALYSLPFTINFHGVTYKMNGIGDVATAPESAGQGGASILLQDALNDMYENNVTLSYLAPFSFAYYRRLGYEQAFSHLHYSLASGDVPSYRSRHPEGHVSRQPLQNVLPETAAFYGQFSQQGLKGGLIRDKWWWNYLSIKNEWQVGLYYDEHEKVQGYVIYEYSPTRLTVKEFLYGSTAAFEHLLSFIFNHKNSVPKINFDSPDVTYHGDWLGDPYSLSSRVVPYMMARIVDLKDFLTRYPYLKQTFGPIVLPVKDESLPQNSGVWRLFAQNGQNEIKKIGPLTSRDTKYISIQQLTKALFGTTSVLEITTTGKAALEPQTVKKLNEILVDEPPELVDYF